MGKIIILDENTANQIAAGEVIERPASIVKEMVENALDANATAITVDIVSGGIKSIRITDNGDGMEADDVELAFERHATSKIRRIEDLNQLSTMGFRGEALASIASVAKVEVVTKTETAQSGIKVVIEGGSVLAVEPAGAPKGTTFTVRELFYNTPARYKFLKKDTTEAGYIQDILTRIALARPDVSFRLLSQGRPVMHTPGNHDLLSTIYSIYGKEIAHAVVPVNASGEGVEVNGYAGKPEIARGNRSFQSILINGRFVYNRIITAALEEAYKTRLMQKRFPFAVLKLSLSPWFVDVNVHPSKLEVRFSDDQKVFRAVYHAVSDALTENASFRSFEATEPARSTANGTINQPSFQEASAKTPSQAGMTYIAVNHQPIGMSEIKEITDKTSPAQDKPDTGRTAAGEQTRAQTVQEYPKQNEFERKLNSQFTQGLNEPTKLFRPVTGVQQTEVFKAGDDRDAKAQESPEHAVFVEPKAMQIPEQYHQTPAPVNDKERLLQARIIGQAFESYLLLEDGEELLLIDQHAAHERIRYEKLKRQFMKREAFGQGLLSPLAVNLSELEMERFHELSGYLHKLGFEVEVFGARSILIRSIPYVLDSSFSGQDFLEILEKLNSEAPAVSEIIPEETLHMMSCKSAIKANRHMSEMEIRALLEQLAQAENPYTCVHGRPVIIRLGKKELEKRFKRIV